MEKAKQSGNNFISAGRVTSNTSSVLFNEFSNNVHAVSQDGNIGYLSAFYTPGGTDTGADYFYGMNSVANYDKFNDDTLWKPFSGASVSIGGFETYTDESGFYRIRVPMYPSCIPYVEDIYNCRNKLHKI